MCFVLTPFPSKERGAFSETFFWLFNILFITLSKLSWCYLSLYCLFSNIIPSCDRKQTARLHIWGLISPSEENTSCYSLLLSVRAEVEGYNMVLPTIFFVFYSSYAQFVNRLTYNLLILTNTQTIIEYKWFNFWKWIVCCSSVREKEFIHIFFHPSLINDLLSVSSLIDSTTKRPDTNSRSTVDCQQALSPAVDCDSVNEC